MSVVRSRSLTMDRAGEFRIRAYGPNHCGVDENLLIQYRMVCKCGPQLDARGFLFDQINVDNFFQSIKQSKLSCEKLTMQCVKKLASRIKHENPKVQLDSIELTLSPAPFKARMTYLWENK